MTLSAYLKRLSLVVLTAALAPVSFASWTVGYDEEAAKCYLEDTSVGWKLWIKTNTKTKVPDYVSVGDVKGYEIDRRYNNNDDANGIASAPEDGVLDLTYVQRDTERQSGGGYPVVSLGRNAFASSSITSFIAPECRSIGVITFQKCLSLRSVAISPDATQIAAESTWSGCTNLVTFSPTYCPAIVTFTSKGSFNGCTRLEGDWRFPNATSAAGCGSFFNGTSVTSVRMDEMTVIEANFASSCSSLTNVYLPKLTKIGGSCFWSSSNLKSVTLGDAISSIPYSTFNGCKSLEYLEPRVFTNVTEIQTHGFYSCAKLRGTLSFPIATTVNETAFYNSGLDELYMPNLKTTLSKSTFSGAANLAKITIGGVGTSAQQSTFQDANKNGDKILRVYWKGTTIPNAFNNYWLGYVNYTASRARIYCRGDAMRAWLTQLKSLNLAAATFHEKDAFATYGDETKSDYPGEITRAIISGYNSSNFWLCDWDYEGDTYNTTIECPEDVGVGDVFVDGELILPRNNVYKIPQDCTLTITYEALNGKLFEDGTGTYVKKGVAAAETIPATTCDKDLMEAAKRQLTLSLTDLAAKNIAEVALVCAKDFTCTTNDNVITWEVMDSVSFDLVYTCAGAYRFEGRSKTLTETYASGISADTSVDLTNVQTPTECEPLWEVVYNKDEAQAYLVNDILGWKIYLKTEGNGTYLYTENGVKGYVIFRDYSNSAVSSAAENWELDLTNVKRDTKYPVVRFDYGAFRSTMLNRLIAPDCQKTGTICFSGCSKLTDIEISPNANSIFNEGAFNGCTSLTNFYPTVFSNVITVTKYGFSGAPVAGDWVFPNLKSSTGAIFDGCKNPNGFTVSLPSCTDLCAGFFRNSTVTRIELPKLTKLPDEMASNASRLGDIALTNAIYQIGGKAFNGCTSLTNLSLNAFPVVTNMGWYAFNTCASLEGTLEFPLVPSFPDSNFTSCKKLTSVIAPKALIGQYTFSGCTSLKTAIIGGYTSTDNANFFLNCTNLTDIYVTDAYPAPTKKMVAMFSWGSDLEVGKTRMDPPVVHVRVADDKDYSAWEALCSCKAADLTANHKKVENYDSVKRKLGFVGNAPEIKSGEDEIWRIQNSKQNVAWLARWPHDWGFTIILR